MMLRIAACITFIICGSVGGIYFSDKLKNYRDSCRQISAMLLQISVLIRYRSMSVYEIFRELKYSLAYPNLSFLNNLPDEFTPGYDFHSVWNSAVQSDMHIGSEEKNCLISFGESFGTSDTEGQLMSIEAASEELKIIAEKRSEEYHRKSKLYKSVGMLFGVMAGIMII